MNRASGQFIAVGAPGGGEGFGGTVAVYEWGGAEGAKGHPARSARGADPAEVLLPEGMVGVIDHPIPRGIAFTLTAGAAALVVGPDGVVCGVHHPVSVEIGDTGRPDTEAERVPSRIRIAVTIGIGVIEQGGEGIPGLDQAMAIELVSPGR